MALVLVIEDDPDAANLVVGWLRRAGHRCLVASDGDSGGALVRERASELALVVLDLNLPGLQGTEILAQIRTDPSTVHLPVLVVSAQASTVERDTESPHQADGYLEKPYTKSELRAAVERLLPAQTPTSPD